jgi:phosphatidate cytidylyltransferase
MIAQPIFAATAGGIVAFLALCTLIGLVLSWRVKTPAGREAVANLNARVRSWWGIVAVFGAALIFGRIVTLLLFTILSFLALREFVSLTPTRRGDHRSLFLAFFIVVPIQYWLIGIDWYGLVAIFIPVYVFLLLPALSAATGDTSDFLTRGKLFGRTKLSPAISPSKTVEGLVGGGLTATLIGAALCGITPFSPLQAAGMSAVIVIGGFFGGFVLSAIKRDLGVKDWGRMIEGHGGVADAPS